MAKGLARVLLRWAEEEGRTFAWRGEHDAFRILLAEILLQRSRSSTVEKVYVELTRRWGEPSSLADASTEEITSVIRPLGLTSRAPRIRELAQAVSLKGKVPTRARELRKLPGVGDYVASATAAALGKPDLPLVDTVSARVFLRYFGGSPRRSATDVAAMAYAAVPRKHWHRLNWAALDLAATICLPKRPQCGRCPLTKRCAWPLATGATHGAWAGGVVAV